MPPYTQTIYLYPSKVTYDPTNPFVRPGQLVCFSMQDRVDSATVDFGSNSPFGEVTQFTLDASDPETAQKTLIVEKMSHGNYSFSVTPDSGSRGHNSRKGSDPEPSTTTSGDLDVVRDPPPKDR